MKVAIACDHGGYKLKEFLLSKLKDSNYNFIDLGCNSNENVHYPYYSRRVTHYVLNEGYDFGILICGTGQGMSMCSNKNKNIRAALCTDATMATLARAHGDSNILCMGGRITNDKVALETTINFLETKFDGGRHLNRIQLYSEVS
jgi:ribose 5-phosphate isomerase B|tara:strand:+ start:454 stop:888 length:435 start_codon:yes stop_codon:yes gene_type:complete